MKRTTVLAIAVAASIAALWFPPPAPCNAQDALSMSTAKVSVDGVADPKEYTYTFETKGMKLRLARTPSSIFAAVSADTDGWVGIGFKSNRMDKAEILIGYYKDGKGNLFEQIGQGRKHSEKKIPYVKSFALMESGSTTVLEVELDSKSLLSAGQKTLPLIIAYGADDNIESYHRARTPVAVKLAD